MYFYLHIAINNQSENRMILQTKNVYISYILVPGSFSNSTMKVQKKVASLSDLLIE